MSPTEKIPEVESQVGSATSILNTEDSPDPEAQATLQPTIKDDPKPTRAFSVGEVSGIVEKWFQDTFINPFWGGNTPIYNRLHEAKHNLLDRLKREG